MSHPRADLSSRLEKAPNYTFGCKVTKKQINDKILNLFFSFSAAIPSSHRCHMACHLTTESIQTTAKGMITKTTTQTTNTTQRLSYVVAVVVKKTRDCRSKKLKVAFRPRKRHLYDANHGIYGLLTPSALKRDDMKGCKKKGGCLLHRKQPPKKYSCLTYCYL